MDKIVENNEWFIKNHKNLYSKYPNKYIVIVDKKVVEKFANLEDAFKFAFNRFQGGEFIILQCTHDIDIKLININIQIINSWMKNLS